MSQLPPQPSSSGSLMQPPGSVGTQPRGATYKFRMPGPCFNCLEMGHLKANCPKLPKLYPLSMSNVVVSADIIVRDDNFPSDNVFPGDNVPPSVDPPPAVNVPPSDNMLSSVCGAEIIPEDYDIEGMGSQSRVLHR